MCYIVVLHVVAKESIAPSNSSLVWHNLYVTLKVLETNVLDINT
jgi:hypothetical protein